MIFEKNVSVQKLVLFCSPDQCQSLCLDAKGFGWRNTHLRRYTEWAPLNWKRERDRGIFCMWVIDGERERDYEKETATNQVYWLSGCGVWAYDERIFLYNHLNSLYSTQLNFSENNYLLPSSCHARHLTYSPPSLSLSFCLSLVLNLSFYLSLTASIYLLLCLSLCLSIFFLFLNLSI